MSLPRAKVKSWVPVEGLIDRRQDRIALSLSNEKFGLRLFLAVASSLFFLLFVAYTMRKGLADWHSVANSRLLWMNTAALILSCLGFQWAKIAANRNQLKGIKNGLLGGGVLALLFIVGQALAWNQLHSMGLYLKASPANSFFYLITGVHGLHLLGGLVAWGKTSVRLFRNENADQLRMSVELLTIYWHFLLVVWLVMFAMML